MTSFNLVDEPWIPVNLISGEGVDVSLRDLFARSRDIRSIECDNPMQTAAVVRLVLAVMYRALTPLFLAQKNHAKNADVTLWKMLWDDETGTLANTIDSYLETWKNRFDLFDAKRPFYQIADLEYSSADESNRGEIKRSLGKMMPDGDIISVFKNSDFAAKVSYAEAARILIGYHSWSTLAPLSPVVGIYPDDELAISRLYPKGHRGWCSSIGITLMVGRNFYETAMLNFVPSQLNFKDVPFWEEAKARKVPILYEMPDGLAKPILKSRNAKPVGQVQLFVWFAKSVRLIPENGKVVAAISSEHDSLSSRSSNVHMARHHETQTAWRETEKGEMAAYHFVSDSVWQNIPAVLPKTRDGFLAPLNVTWSAKVVNLLGIRLPARIRIIGASTDDRAQTFRGVIDKSVTISSLSKLDNPVVTARIADTAETLTKMVRTYYYGFARDVLSTKYGEVSSILLDALMSPANVVLDKSFVSLFRLATDPNEPNVDTVIDGLVEHLIELSQEVANDSNGTDLLGKWHHINGENKLLSIAASRARLLRGIQPERKKSFGKLTEDAGFVRWAINKNLASKKLSPEESDLDEFVLGFWSGRKNLPSGAPVHIVEKTPYDSFSVLRKSDGAAFDERVSDLFDAKDDATIKESLRRLAGVANSQGYPMDFGTLAAIGKSIHNPELRLEIAQDIADRRK